jgi:Zn-dependent M28 family amino/carboxypeptidase
MLSILSLLNLFLELTFQMIDSVSTSYGATDDGGGVSVALALMRHLIYHPVEHTVIFNINNAEEDGLLGSTAFMGASPNSTTETGPGHPWKKYVKAFINLGKMTLSLFRS